MKEEDPHEPLYTVRAMEQMLGYIMGF